MSSGNKLALAMSLSGRDVAVCISWASCDSIDQLQKAIFGQPQPDDYCAKLWLIEVSTSGTIVDASAGETR